jgi:two-component system, NarL family, response regulator
MKSSFFAQENTSPATPKSPYDVWAFMEDIISIYPDCSTHSYSRHSIFIQFQKSTTARRTEIRLNVIKVVILDDHPILRMGLRCCLEQTGDISVVGEENIGKNAFNLVAEYNPDVLLIGVKPPGRRGFELVRRVKKIKKPPRILILGSNSNRVLIKKMLFLGVDGYMIKADPAVSILEAVRGLARGKTGWFSRQVLEKMSDLIQGEGNEIGVLSWREMEVLEAVVESKTNREIAVVLNISEKTVEKHLENIFFKLDVTSRVEAAVLALKEGLVAVPSGEKSKLLINKDGEPLFSR